MNKIIKELNYRKTIKTLISQKIKELIVIDNYPKPIKKKPIHLILLDACHLHWSPRIVILVNECLMEAGVKKTKSKGYPHFINIVAYKAPGDSLTILV